MGTIGSEAAFGIEVAFRIEENLIQVPSKVAIAGSIGDRAARLLRRRITDSRSGSANFIGAGQPGVISVEAAPGITGVAEPVIREAPSGGNLNGLVIPNRLRIRKRQRGPPGGKGNAARNTFAGICKNINIVTAKQHGEVINGPAQILVDVTP